MNARAALLNNGPLVLLSKLASAFSIESGADFRAQVTIHARGGKTWTGIPVEVVEDRQNRAYVVLEIHPKKNTVVLDFHDIQAVEFENMETIHSYLEKPWLRDGKFRNVSKLQFNREMETLWSTLPHLKVKAELEKFPATEDIPGNLLAWITALKTEVDKLMADSMGKEALMQIDQFTVTSGTEPITLSKDGKNFTFAVSLTKDSFDKAHITQLLNDNL